MWFGKGDKVAENSEVALRQSQTNMSAQMLRNSSQDIPHPTTITTGDAPRSDHHARHESFDMSGALMESSVEQSAKAQAMVWSRPVVDGSDIDKRIQKLRDEEQAARVPAKEAVAIDPESSQYRAWLGLMILLAAFQVSTVGYYLAFREVFSSNFHAVFAVDWLIDVVRSWELELRSARLLSSTPGLCPACCRRSSSTCG